MHGKSEKVMHFINIGKGGKLSFNPLTTQRNDICVPLCRGDMYIMIYNERKKKQFYNNHISSNEVNFIMGVNGSKGWGRKVIIRANRNIYFYY